MFLKKIFKYKFWFLLCLVLFVLLNLVRTIYKFGDFNSTVIVNTGNFKNAQPIDFLKDTSIKREFKSNFNNLGIISVKFNTHNRINTGFLQFRIREKGNEKWYYLAKYKVDQFQNNKYFPFGFPEIIDSKTKVYEFEILSLDGTENNMVSIGSVNDQFLVKYSFPKKFLFDNKTYIPVFIFNKIISYFNNIDFSVYLMILFESVVLFFLTYLLFVNINFLLWLNFVKNNFLNVIMFELKDYFIFFKKNKTLFSLLLLVLFAGFGFELTHFTLSIDEEYGFLNGIHPKDYIGYGRFGLALIKELLRTSWVVPYWDTFMALLFLFMAVTFVCSITETFLKKMKISRKMQCFLLFVLGASFISFPTNAAYFSFLTYNFEVSIGILMTVLAAKFFLNSIFTNKKGINLFLSVLFLSYSIAVYQAFICLFLCVTSFIFILSILSKEKKFLGFKKNLKILLNLFLTVLISVIFYKLIDFLFSLQYPSIGYVEKLMIWGKVSFHDIYLGIKNYYFSEVFSNEALFFYKMFFLSVVFVLFGFVYKFFVIKNNKIFFTFWFFVLFISPFLLTFFSGYVTLLRTMQAVAFLSGAVLVLTIVFFRNKYLIFLFSLFSVIVIFLQTQQLSLIFSSDYIRYEQDINLAHRIMEKVYSLGFGDQLNGKIKEPIVITGKITRQHVRENIRMETLGYSFFEWDNGNPFRISLFLKYLGYNLQSPSPNLVSRAKVCQKNMISWPDDGSVALCDGILVVKLSEL